MAAHAVRYPAGAQIREHRHGEPTVTFVLDGAFTERLGDRIEACRTADVVFRPSGTPHADRGGDRPSDCLTLTVGELGTAEVRPLKVRSPHLRRCACLLALAVSLPAISACQLEHLGEDLLRQSMHVARIESAPSALGRMAMLHLERNGGQTLSDLARDLDVHRSHLAREFRRAHGCTVGEFSRVLRIDTMVRTLARRPDDLPLAAVAIDAGYCDHGHMTRACREHLGLTPSELRGAISPRAPSRRRAR